jgi:hypothetical protein
MAALSAAAIIPIAGYAATGIKYGKKAMKAGSKASDEVVDVYRVYGGDAKPDGWSWTPDNPNDVPNFRDAAGLPSGGQSGATNTGRFVIEGTVNTKNINNIKMADPLDGKAGNGVREYIIDPKNVQINRV